MVIKNNSATRLKMAVLVIALAACIGSLHARDAISEGEPLASRLQGFDAAVKRGDAVTTSSVFRDANVCLAVQRIDERASATMQDKRFVLNDSSADSGERTRALAQLEGAQKKAAESREMCEGTEQQITNARIYDIALAAAKLGDATAMACFIASPWPVENADVDPAKASEYRDEAKALTSHAIETGDWRVVKALAVAASGNNHGGYALYIQKPDLAAQLRYEKLLRLGAAANSNEAKNLDLAIEALSSRVSPQDALGADAWAKSAYSKYFVTKSSPEEAEACHA